MRVDRVVQVKHGHDKWYIIIFVTNRRYSLDFHRCRYVNKAILKKIAADLYRLWSPEIRGLPWGRRDQRAQQAPACRAVPWVQVYQACPVVRETRGDLAVLVDKDPSSWSRLSWWLFPANEVKNERCLFDALNLEWPLFPIFPLILSISIFNSPSLYTVLSYYFMCPLFFQLSICFYFYFLCFSICHILIWINV